MKVYQRYLAREIYSAVTLVLVAFLMLFAFFDFINELQSLGKGSYQLRYMSLFVLLTLPGHIYELAPIAVLIGTLYALTMLARHSEITVLRASGLSTRRLPTRKPRILPSLESTVSLWPPSIEDAKSTFPAGVVLRFASAPNVTGSL